MEAQDAREVIIEHNPEAILWEGLDSCLVGVSVDGRAVYDIEKMLRHFEDHEDMNEEDAMEHLEYNILGAYVGEYTPIHINLLPSSND